MSSQHYDDVHPECGVIAMSDKGPANLNQAVKQVAGQQAIGQVSHRVGGNTPQESGYRH